MLLPCGFHAAYVPQRTAVRAAGLAARNIDYGVDRRFLSSGRAELIGWFTLEPAATCARSYGHDNASGGLTICYFAKSLIGFIESISFRNRRRLEATLSKKVQKILCIIGDSLWFMFPGPQQVGTNYR